MEKTNNSKKENNGNNSPKDTSGEQQKNESWINEYYNAVKAGFMRVWLNRYLWFWGILLPTGFGINANFNLNSDDFSQGGSMSEDSSEFFQKVEYFFSEYLAWIVIGVLIIFAMMLLFWVLSAIARSGVIQALDVLQSPKGGAVDTFKSVWKKGKSSFLQVLLIDFTVGFAMLLILLILASPIVLLVVQGHFVRAGILAIFAFLIYIPLVLLSIFIKRSGVIVSVLSNLKALRSIEIAYSYVRWNIKESLKLLLTIVVLGIVQSLAAFAVLFPIIIVIVGATLLIVGLSGGNFNDAGSNIFILIIIAIISLVLIAILLFLKSIFSLWFQDLWLWWTKKIGCDMPDKAKEEMEAKEAVKKKAVPSTE